MPLSRLAAALTAVALAGAVPTSSAGAAGPAAGTAAAASAATVASIDGGPLLPASAVELGAQALRLAPAPGRAGLQVDAGPGGWSVGEREFEGLWLPYVGSAGVRFAGRITVSRLVPREDGAPAQFAAYVTGRQPFDEGVPVRALVVVDSDAGGLPAYVVAEPSTVRTPVPASSDQTFPLTLRNVGGTAGVLDSARATAGGHGTTAWSVAPACLGAGLPAGGSCLTSVRVVQLPLEEGSRWPYARAVWSGPDGLSTTATLEAVPQSRSALPVVSVRVPGEVLDSATAVLSASDPQGDAVALHCRLDDGPFQPCAPSWSTGPLSTGYHRLTAYGTDPQGNVSDWVHTAFEAQGRGERDVLAVTGLDRGLYDTVWPAPLVYEGGQWQGGPAIARAGDEVYTVAVGIDRNVYVRSTSLTWQALAPASTRCSGPSIAVSGSVLAVACRGDNGRLYVAKAPLVPGQLPRVSRWTDRGGAVLYGATAGVRSGAFSYTVVGTNHALYETGDSGGFRRLPGTLRCYGAAGQDSFHASALACRAESGALQVVSDRTSGTVQTVGGRVVGRPGVAADADGGARYYVLGTDARLHVARRHPDGTTSGFRAGPPGYAGRYGVAAGVRRD